MCKKILSFFLFLVILNSCASKKNEIKKQTQIIDQSIPGNFSSQTLQFLDSTSIQLFLDSFPGFSAVATDMHTFYTGRNFSFAWFDSSGMIEQAGNLFNRVKNITDDGIDSNKMMYRAELSNLMDNPSAVVLDSNALKTELMLTAQYLTYAKTVWAGIDEKQSLALEWLLPRNKISYNQMLDSLLSGKDVLNNPPVYRQ